MEFIDVSDWMINEGAVLRVIDSFNRIIWEKTTPPENTYFYVEDVSGSANTLSITKKNANAPTITVYKSSNQQTWTSMGSTSTTAITATIPANGKLYLKATTSTWCTNTDAYNCNEINCSGNFNVGGNIMSLLYGDNFGNQTTFSTTYTFTRLFYGKNTLISAANLVLPATTLTSSCYRLMFCNCTALSTAPALPAITLDEECYSDMFKGCTSLPTTPTISATTLAEHCCYNMFRECTALTTPPTLPATTLATACYSQMFYGCTSLTTPPALPATTLAPSCYYSMFSGCSALTTAPALPATTLANMCYSSMFSRCTALTTAPVLPATTLASECYEGMFSGCTSLNSVTTYADDISATNCLQNWLGNVAASGTFYNNGTAVYTVDSASGIPQGWTEVGNYFYVEDVSGSANTLSITKKNANAPTITVYKSTDGTNWTSMGNTSTTAITTTIPVNGKLYLKATANYWGQNVALFNNITASGNHNVGGNSMSLLYGDNFANQTVFPTNDIYCLNSLFKNNTTLISAANLQLPSTTLVQGCYDSMFYGCTSLTTAPALPATTLTTDCYVLMFSGCTSLTTAPVLPATTLVQGCYQSMFYGCTSLNSITTYANDISASYCINNWLLNVAPTGTFNNLGLVTYTRGASGIPAGWTEVKPIYFYIEDVSGAANTLSIAKYDASAPTIEVFKSTDQQNWTSMGNTSTTAITATVPANGKLYLKATANAWVLDNALNYNFITASGSHNVGGNIMSLLYGDNYVSQTELPAVGYNLINLFKNNTTLISASHLYLPATVTIGCYQGMFHGCTSLTTPPALPATTLAPSCYGTMFYGCTSLTTAPVLPATTLAYANSCYSSMFSRCTALTTAPTLPATTLAYGCYEWMFDGCTSLTTAPALPATTLVNECYRQMFSGCTSLNSITTYANDISATNCLQNWLDNVAPTGTFHNEGTAVYTTDSPSGIPTGWSEPVTSSGYFYLENTSRFIDDEIVITSSGNAPVFDIYYSYDAIDWDLLGTTGGSDIYTDFYADEKIYLKAETSAWGTSVSDYITIGSNAPHNVGGNIMSLLYGDNYENKTLADTSTTYNFVKLFVDDVELEDASDLVLPSDVTGHCYRSMFYGCTSLTTAPTLNATTLAPSCYREMFRSCSSLNTIITYASTASSVNLMNWVRDVAASGDFYNLGGATYGSGNSGIPSGWTEHNSL